MLTIGSILQKRAKQKSSQTAYLFLGDGLQETQRLTYGDLDKKARAVAAYLQSKCALGDRVLLVFPSGLEFITAFFGCMYAGMVAVPAYCHGADDFEKKQDFFKTVAAQASINCVLTDKIFYPLLEEHANFLFANPNTQLADSTRFEDCAILYKPPVLNECMVAYLQFTSGSTSSPKAAIVTHKNLIHNIKNSGLSWQFSRKSISLTWAPHGHVYGLVCGLLVPFYFRSLAIVMPSHVFLRKPFFWLRAITKYRVTHSGCPNFGYDLCVKSVENGDFARLQLKSWKVAVNGGEHISPETLLLFAEKFKTVGFKINSFCCAYGMSELSGTISATHHRKKPRFLTLSTAKLSQNKIFAVNKTSTHVQYVSVGSVLSGLSIRIIDPESLAVLPEGSVGEIVIAGKSLVKGYWAEESEKFFIKLPGNFRSYFRTGDLGFLNKSELFVTGRLKEIIVRYGKNYYPHDLEECVLTALEKFPVANRVVFSVPILGREEIIFLQEVKGEICESESHRIIYSIRLAVLKYYGLELHQVILVQEDSLPKTNSGKIARKLCAQLYLADELKLLDKDLQRDETATADEELASFQADIPATLLGEFNQLLAACFDEESDEALLEKPLSNFKIDSLKAVNFIAAFNDLYNLEIKPNSLYEYYTFGEFFADIYHLYQSHFERIDTSLGAKLQTQHQEEEVLDLEVELETEFANQVTYRENDIAIIGMEGIFPGAKNLETFWDNLVQGKDAITSVPEYRTLLHPTEQMKQGGFLENIAEFDAEFFNISPREAQLMDPQQRLFLQVVWRAIEDAGYAVGSLAQKKVGLYVGVFGNDYAELLQQNTIADSYLTTGITHSILANRVSYILNLQGPSEAIDTACSSSLVALHHAIIALQNGDCELAIVGGVNTLLSPNAFVAATAAGMLSTSGRCKTFDKDADGYVRSEGVVAILIKPLSKALLDQDNIYAVIKGSAVNHGGHVSSLTAPNPNAQSNVILAACKRANISPSEISYIEAHGTGTPLGDPIEINGLKKAFSVANERNESYFCGIGALKTHIGHLEAAAGIASIIKAALCLKNKMIPGNLHLEDLNSYIDLQNSPFYLVNYKQSWNAPKDNNGKVIPRTAGVSSFGYGGTNAHVILQEIATPSVQEESPASSYLVTLSAKTKVALLEKINELALWLGSQATMPSLLQLSFTLNKCRDHFSKKLALVVSSIAELEEALSKLQLSQTAANIFSNNELKKSQPIFQSLCDKSIQELSKRSLTVAEYRQKLNVLAAFYVEGYNIDWDGLYRKKIVKLKLPTYPFAKEHHWLPTNLGFQVEAGTNAKLFDISLESVRAKLTEVIRSLLKINKPIESTCDFHSLGLDSLSFKELTLLLQNDYCLELTPAIFFSYQNIEQLSLYLFERLSQTESRQHFAAKKPLPVVTDIAIVGLQGYFPQSKDVQTFWNHLVAGHDLISEVPANRWNWHEVYDESRKAPNKANSKWGGFIPDVDLFDAEFFNISAREANLMDPQQRLFLEVVWKTLEDAGYNPLRLASQKVGVFVGTEFNDYQTLIQSQKTIFHGHLATGNSNSLLANRVSYYFNFHGPSEVINTACSSALVAIHRGITALQQGECELVVAGAVSLMLSPDSTIITSQLGALSSDGRCKTFDAAANGYVKGEGVAALILKPLQRAIADGDCIYGVIKGSSVSHAGKAQSLTAPNAVSQSELLLQVYRAAKINPQTVTYLETHGTGTELGDPVEIEGLKLAFEQLLQENQIAKPREPFCGLGSVKTNCGHLEPASGMASLVKVLWSMKTQTIPGNLHFTKLNPYIQLENTPFYIHDRLKTWQRLTDETGKLLPLRAGISSFGFGGTNSHLIVEEFLEASSETIIPSNQFYLVALSAKYQEGLRQKIQDLMHWLQAEGGTATLESISYTLNVGRAHFDYRSCLLASSLQDLQKTLREIINGNQVENYFFEKCVAENTVPSLSPDLTYLELAVIAKHYVNGDDIDWDKLYNEPHRITGLPTYPFDGKRYWFDAELTVRSNPTLEERVSDSKQDLHTLTQEYLCKIFSEQLKVASEKLNINKTYELYGVDSVLSVEITNRLEEDLGGLPKTLLYEENTIANLAQYLVRSKHQALEKMFSHITFEQRQDSNDKVSITPPITLQSKEIDIAIVGMSIQFPMAKNHREFWKNLKSGKDCIIEIPEHRWRYQDFPIEKGQEQKYYKYGGFLEDIDKFDPLFFNISPREAMLMDPQERLFLQTAWSALEDGGFTREQLQTKYNNEVGVFAGVTYNFYPLLIAEEWQKGNQLPLDIQTFSIANRISYFLNLRGPSLVIDTACSSSLAAIHVACENILQGTCRMAIAGGVNLSIHPTKYHFLGSYNLLSDKGRCESFAAGGDGYVPGEGVGAVLLKPLSQALQDGDLIYGVIKGSSTNHGGKTSGYTVPNPKAHKDLINQTLAKANVAARTISYLEAHGTGTALGDPIEVRGLQEAFEEETLDKQFCAIGSVKSNIGHLESAAGISQLAKVILQMQHQQLVPSLHAKQTNPYIDFENSPFYVQQDLTPWQCDYPRRSGISSFGAGGTNVHLIVEEFSPPQLSQNTTGPYLFVLSAQNQERLLHYAQEFWQFLQEVEFEVNLANLCYTLQIGREEMASRLAIVFNNYSELVSKLNLFLKQNNEQNSYFTNAATFANTISGDLYNETASKWVNGDSIAWQQFYVTTKPNRISLPTYPFAKRRCWVSAEPALSIKTSVNITKSQQPVWLLFQDKELGCHLLPHLAAIECFTAEHFSQLNDKVFYLNPKEPDHFRQLFAIISKKNIILKGILYLWQLTEQLRSDCIKVNIPNLISVFKEFSWQNAMQFWIVQRAAVKSQEFRTELLSKEFPEQLKLYMLELSSSKHLSNESKFLLQELKDSDFIPSLTNQESSEVRVLMEDPPLAQPSPAIQDVTDNDEEILTILLSNLAKILGLNESEIELDVQFLHYGLDSILGINFVAELDQYFHDVVTPMDLYRYTTVKQLADFIAKNYRAQVPTQEPTADSFEKEISEDLKQLDPAAIAKLLEDELQDLDKFFNS